MHPENNVENAAGYTVHGISNKLDSKSETNAPLEKLTYSCTLNGEKWCTLKSEEGLHPMYNTKCLQHCQLPALVTMNQKLVHSGLCSVARKLVRMAHKKTPHMRYNRLLGHHEMSVRACAEVSMWTHFCEVEMPNLVTKVRNRNSLEEIPVELVKFENHLRQVPVIAQLGKKNQQIHQILTGKTPLTTKSDDWIDMMNNLSLKTFMESNNKEDIEDEVRKLKSTIKKEKCEAALTIRHDYAEGVQLTLTDLILLPSVAILLEKLTGHLSCVLSHLPHVVIWYNRMTTHSPVITDALYKAQLPVCSYLNNTALSVSTQPDCSSLKSDLVKQKIKIQTWEAEKVLLKLEDVSLTLPDNPWMSKGCAIDWDSMPNAAHPAQGDLPKKRLSRKCEQLENLVKVIVSMANPGDVIVDFCAGGGHLGILLAHYLPQCQILLVENKEDSIRRAAERITSLTLNNITLYQSNLDYFHGRFDIGTCLHGCGLATDLVLHACMRAKAPFVLCPCCYGGIKNTKEITYPQSEWAKQRLCYKEFELLAHAADDEHKGKRYMIAVDQDRSHAAMEMNYDVKLLSMTPLTCSPKNNLIVGTLKTIVKSNE